MRVLALEEYTDLLGGTSRCSLLGVRARLALQVRDCEVRLRLRRAKATSIAVAIAVAHRSSQSLFAVAHRQSRSLAR